MNSPLGHLGDLRRLRVRRRFRLFVNQYDVFGESRDPIAFVDAPRGGREVLTYRDDRLGTPDVIARARHGHRWLDGIDVTAGEPIGVVRAESRWGPRQWFVEPVGREPLTGRERSTVGAFLRGVGYVFVVLPATYDFGAFTVRRRFGLTRYTVDITDDTLDRRLVLAAVAIIGTH